MAMCRRRLAAHSAAHRVTHGFSPRRGKSCCRRVQVRVMIPGFSASERSDMERAGSFGPGA